MITETSSADCVPSISTMRASKHRLLMHLLGMFQSLMGPRYVLPHGSYLVNLAQQEKAKAKQAYDSFVDDLRRCEALGITLYNFQ